MLVSVIDIAAVAVGLVMAAAPLLQFQRVRQRKHSDDVSLGMLWLLVAGGMTWMAYGVAHGLAALIIANTLGLTASSATVAIVLRYRTRKRP